MGKETKKVRIKPEIRAPNGCRWPREKSGADNRAGEEIDQPFLLRAKFWLRREGEESQNLQLRKERVTCAKKTRQVGPA